MNKCFNGKKRRNKEGTPKNLVIGEQQNQNDNDNIDEPKREWGND